MSNIIPWSEIRKSYGGDTEASESPNPFRRRKVEDYLQPETAETEDEFSLLDALSAGTGRFMEHVGTGIEDVLRPDSITPSEWKKHQSDALRTVIETLQDEGNAMFERNHHQYEDNSVPYHLQNIFESVPESAAIMAGSMIAGAPVGGLLGAAGKGLIKGAEMLPRGLSMVDKLYRAYNASNPAAKVARTLMPQNARVLTSAEMGAGMEAYVEQLEAEKRYIENAKRNGTYVQDQTEAEAKAIGNNVFWDNMGIISAFNLPQYNMLFGKGAKSLLGKAGRLAAAAGTEGAEEVSQEIASAHELGEPVDSRTLRDAFIAGAGMGTGFHTVGRGIGYVGDRIAGRPSDEEIERLEQARSETFKKLSELIAKTETDDSGNTRYAGGSIYGDYRRDFSGGIQSGLNSARKALDGKQMDNGTVGCVEAVTKILAHVHPEFQKMVDDGVVNTVEGENSLHSRLEKMGVEIIPFDEANVAAGDIIFYDGKQTYQHVLVADHKDADGNWRVFGNSSSANKVMEQPLYQGQTPAWIAKVSNISGFNPQNGSPSQGNAYDPNFSDRQNRMWQAAQRAAAYANEKYGMNLQPDWLYRQLAHEAGSNFDSNPELAANHNYGGLKGGKKAIGEDSRGHKYFANDDDFFEAYVDEFIGLRPELKEAKSLEDFARIMKETDYYRDSYENYVAGMKGVQVPNAGRSSGQSADATGMESWDDYLKERMQPRQEEPPMQARQIDFKATDDETKSVFDGFAKEQANKAIADGDGDTALFFLDMFNGDEFQNTPENRAAIAERYGNELTQFAQAFTPTLSQATEQTQTVSVSAPRPQAQPAAGSTANQYIRNNDVIQAGNNFLEELRAKGTQADMATTVRLQAAVSNGDTATVESILKANNRPVAVQQPQQQQQTDPVKQNQTPENVLTQQQQPQQQESAQPQQTAKPKKQPKTPEEKAQSSLAKPIQGGKVKTRRKAGNAVIFLAEKNGIEIPDADRKSLEHGNTKVINQWRDTLIGKGILSSQATQQPQQTQPSQPQQQAQPANKPLTLQDRMQQVVNEATEAARQNWEDIQQDYQQRGALARMPQSADINRALASRPSAGTFSRRTDARRDVQEMRDLDTIPAWRGRTREDNLALRRQARDNFRQMREARATNMINSLPETEVPAQTGIKDVQNTEDTVNVNRSLAEIQAREQQARKAQEAQRQQEQAERARLDSYTRDDTQPEIGAERGTRNPETELYHVESPQEIAVREQQAREARRAQARQDIAYSDAESQVEIGAVRGEKNPETESYRVETPQEINAREQRAREARQARARQDVAYSDTESHPEVGAVQGRETPETEPYHVETPQEIATRERQAREARTQRDNTYSDNESFQEVGATRGTRNPEVETPHVETPQEIRAREQRGREAEQEQQRRTDSYARDDAQEGDGAVQGRNDIEAEPYHVQTQEEITAERERVRTEQTQRNASYSDGESHQEVGSKQGGNVSSKATTPKQQQKNPLTDEQLKDLLAKIKNAAYQSMEGDANTDIIEFVDDKDLTPAQKLLKPFSEKLGVPLKFFRNPDGKFHGSFSNGVLFLNVNSKKGLGGVFWHESFHWLKANNPKLYAKLVEAAGITDKDRQAFLDRTGRKDLKTNEEIDEEILADQMDDVAKRTGLLQSIAGKNRGVVERVVQWLKDTMNKFIETFRNPTGRLTTKQAQALAKEFGQIARQLKDENGEQIFRVNNRTGDIEVVEGRKARELSNEEIEAAAKSLDRKLSFAGINALTADLNAFDKAEEMASKGASREEIFKETKLVRGKDGLYRFEIPDNLDKIDFAPLVKNGRATLGEIYKNSKLYAAYPKLRDMEVVATSERLGKNGAYWLGFEYDPVKGHTLTERININLSPKGLPVAAHKAWAKQQRSTLIHEIQHAIQAREQFATGGDALNVRAKLADARGDVTIAEGESDHDLYWRLGGEQEAREAQDRAELKARKKEEKRLRSELTDIIPTLPPDTQKKFKDFIAATKAKSDDMFDIADSLPDDANKDILTDWANAVDGIEEFSKRNGRIPQIHGDNAIIIRGEYGADVYSAQSVSNPNDNSSESWGQTIKNFASTVFNGKPQSKNHKQFIVDKLEELTRYKTYFNTNDKNEADVVIDSFQKIIRARHAYDFEKLLPAAGEPIAKVLGLTPSDKLSDCIANWMMTGVLTSSQEATAFQKAMRAHPAEAELLQSIRDTFQEMANMSAEEAVESNIVRDKKSKTFREWLGEKFSKEEWVDDLHPIKRAYDQMLAKAPPAVADIIKKNIDPYMSASLFRGKGAITDMMIGDKKEVTAEDIDIVRRVLQHEFPNVDFSNFKPLAAIAKMVGYDVEGLERYALAKLDKEMYEKKNSGDPKYADLTPSYTEAQCDEIIKAGKAKYDAAQRALVDYSNTLAAIQYSTGVISVNQFLQRVNGWKNYVPTARVFEEYEDISVDKSDSSKHKTGSKRRVYAPLGKLEDNTNLFIRQALQNRARLEIVTMARLGNFGDIVAETPKGYPQGHTIHFKENGKMKYLVTPDESLKRAVEAIQTPADANIVVQAFKTVGMVMRGLYTMFNVEFAVGNPFRDMADAFIHNKYGSRNPFVAIPAMVSAAVSGFAQSVGAQIKSEEFRTFLAEGGAQSGFSYEITEGASKRVNSFGKKSLAKNVWDKFITIAEASENMTRFSTFKTAKDNLAKQHGGVPTPHDLKLAAMQARRATVDFARAGHTMRGVNKVALFSNAAMQSLALWGEKINAFRKGKEGAGEELSAAVFKMFMSGVMPALALVALNFPDDDRRKRFEQRPTWEKDTYWIFGDGLRVPKGMDLGIKLTSALTEEFAMWLASNKPAEWKRIANNIWRGLPSITTTIFTPAVESYMNYSIFKDAPIVPYGQQDDPKYKQYGKNTSWVAKQLGNMFNLSPRQIDHLIAGYGGSMATALTGGSDGKPIVRRFMFDPDKNPRIVQDYYKALEEQEEMLAEYKARRADGEKVELPEDYDRGLHARLKNSREAMRRISKAEMRIMDDPKLDADKREEKLRELEKRRVALCERVLGKAR